VGRTLGEYVDTYEHVRIRREEGVIELRLHSDDGPLVWGSDPHGELGHCFSDVGRDPENRIAVITGTGGKFIADLDQSWVGEMTPAKYDAIYRDGKRLLGALLEIEVPIVAAVEGPASVHAELALLSDIVVASETASFSDAPHFRYGTVPGDGVHLIWPLLLGPNRGRHFLLTGKRLSASEALEAGVVAEVVPAGTALERAWEVARELALQPDLTLRYTRVLLTQQLRRTVLDGVGHGLALEGLAAYDSWPKG
jgi:enoyl-CoA hydratase/carnithine racemase